MFKLGSAWKMFKRLNSMNDGRDVSKAILSSPAERQRVAVILGRNPKNLERIMTFRGAERDMARTSQTLVGNSTTAKQAEAMEQFGGRRVGRWVREPRTAILDWLDNTLMKATGVTEAEKSEIARILTSTDPNQLDAVLSEIARAADAAAISGPSRAAGDMAGGLVAGEAARAQLLR